MHLSVVRALQRVEGEELNCVCGEILHKTDASMLHCDTCDDWYVSCSEVGEGWYGMREADSVFEARV